MIQARDNVDCVCSHLQHNDEFVTLLCKESGKPVSPQCELTKFQI